ncbi:MAG: SIMPL domain-containing protein [Candidatus Saccharimonadales bacterium]
MTPQFPSSPQNKRSVLVDLRVIIVVLLVVIGVLLVIWKPWATKLVSDRTVHVTGDATITAKPDEFLFYPSYEFKNADKAAALAAVSQKSADIVKQLKALGIADKDIKTSSSGYDYPIYYGGDGNATYTLQVTVTAHDLAGAQKAQDYLVTTTPTGGVTPQANFSDKKRKELEAQARNAAAKDARTKADDMAKNVGFKVVKVKAISDDQGFGNGGIRPLMSATDSKAMSTEAATPSLAVQPGENDLQYTVTVEYYIK